MTLTTVLPIQLPPRLQRLRRGRRPARPTRRHRHSKPDRHHDHHPKTQTKPQSRDTIAATTTTIAKQHKPRPSNTTPLVIVPQVTTRRLWGLATLTAVTALALTNTAPAQTTARPGDPQAGRKIFKQFCARCHNFQANGTHATAKGGVQGSDLDILKPRYSRIVTAIVQGEGGLPAEYFLARLTFQQIYDVASFVAKYAGKPTPKTTPTGTKTTTH